MTYKYLPLAPPYNQSQKEVYKGLFQETLNQQFSNSSDVWTIQEETEFASGEYQDIQVRITTHIVENATGKYLSDDYKKILFQDLEHATSNGYMYYFSHNYWITISSEKTKNLAASSIVKRCNNTLRWRDLDGDMHSAPCSIDYAITRNMDRISNQAVVVMPAGLIDVVVQWNDETNTIRPNQRFLFGNADNWTAFRIEGGGINNYNNVKTLDNTSVGYMHLSMYADYISDNDDLTNGIAYEEKNQYAVSLNQTSITGIINDVIQLYPTVTLNGLTVTRDTEWETSSVGIMTVGSTGTVKLISGGTGIITCYLAGDTGVGATASVNVGLTGVDNYQIMVNPKTNYVLEGATGGYSVYLYKNGIAQANEFFLGVNPNTVPTDHFAFSYSATPGNTFVVENIEMYLNDDITITYGATGGYTGAMDISLRGSW